MNENILEAESAIKAAKNLKSKWKDDGAKFKTPEDLAVNAILCDLADRGEIKRIFGEIEREDPEMYNHIKKTWKIIIKKAIKDIEV